MPLILEPAHETARSAILPLRPQNDDDRIAGGRDPVAPCHPRTSICIRQELPQASTSARCSGVLRAETAAEGESCGAAVAWPAEGVACGPGGSSGREGSRAGLLIGIEVGRQPKSRSLAIRLGHWAGFGAHRPPNSARCHAERSRPRPLTAKTAFRTAAPRLAPAIAGPTPRSARPAGGARRRP